jgi:hypothetical protein
MDEHICRTHLNAGSRQHSVDTEDAPFHTVGQDTLAVAPHRVGSIGSTNLARSETESCCVTTLQYSDMAQNGNILLYVVLSELGVER